MHHRHRFHHHHSHIYRSHRHALWTLVLLVIPFCIGMLLWGRGLEKLPIIPDLAVSSVRLSIAYVFSAIIGWALAVGFYSGKRAVVALPIFDVLQSFPTFAVLPLATFFWGKSSFTVIFFLVITIVWPIFFTLISALKMARNDWKEASQVYNLKGWDYIRLYLWPVTLPGLVMGSIIGLGEGWEALIATEMIAGSDRGLGPLFQSISDDAGMTALGVFGLLVFIFAINKIIWLPLLEWSHHKHDD